MSYPGVLRYPPGCETVSEAAVSMLLVGKAPNGEQDNIPADWDRVCIDGRCCALPASNHMVAQHHDRPLFLELSRNYILHQLYLP